MPVDIEIIATKNENGKQWDIGSICEEVSLNYVLNDTAATMEISCVKVPDIDLVEGDVVSLKVDGVHMFYGWIFKKSFSAYESVKYKAYDIKRYLAYKDVMVTSGETVNEFFERICKAGEFPYKVVDTSSYKIPSKIHDGETLNTMLEYAIDQTFIGTEERFCVRANGSTLELVNCSKQLTDVIVGDKSLLLDYEFSTDIENTYTTFKIQREAEGEDQKKKKEENKGLKRDKVVWTDQENVKKWGVLQYYEKMDSKWTMSQINAHLELLKARYNKQTKTLKLECLGDTKCIAGNMITLLISDLEEEKVAQGHYVLITSATHKISHNEHTMSLDVEVI